MVFLTLEGWGFKSPSPIFIAYLTVWFLTLFLHLFYPHLKDIILPIVLLGIPLILAKALPIRFNLKDLLIGLFVSFVVLAPLASFLVFHKSLQILPSLPGWNTIVYQLIGVAFPEEAFFRGFIQESLGRKVSSIIYTSLLFSLCHLPYVIAGGSPVVLLTFFPSLVMGVLYQKTSNILPSVVFHFSSNLFFLSLY